MLAHVRVRVIELRILGAVLAALWLTTFALILLGYRPGGPVDVLVGLAWIALRDSVRPVRVASNESSSMA